MNCHRYEPRGETLATLENANRDASENVADKHVQDMLKYVGKSTRGGFIKMTVTLPPECSCSCSFITSDDFQLSASKQKTRQLHKVS